MKNTKDFYTCKLCGRRLKAWKSIQRGVGASCKKKYLDNLYRERQITIESVCDEMQKKGS